MEEALLQMKKRYDDLLNETIDSADGPTVQLKITSANDEVQQLKDELKKREAVHAERIVEMVCNFTTKKTKTKMFFERKKKVIPRKTELFFLSRNLF